MLFKKNKKSEVKRSYDHLSLVNTKIVVLRNARKLGKTKLNGDPKNIKN
ncbi:MAG: hypothetical protein ACI9OE_002688 [Mariniflexile sp.]|jgi:hypothetical protein